MIPPDPAGWAAAWADGWNRADIDAVLAGWAEGASFSSARLGGTAVGKAAVRAWWSEALTPGLTIAVEHVLVGHDALVLVYVDHLSRVRAEAFEFDDAGLVVRAAAFA